VFLEAFDRDPPRHAGIVTRRPAARPAFGTIRHRQLVESGMPSIDSGAPLVDVRRADRRFHTSTSWLDSRHSFSFGPHYDPRNTHFGALVASNHDVVAPGTGFETHPHRDMEIVTWVLSGSLVHQDSTGHAGLVHPGLAQRMSAGAGILHSEKHDGRSVEPVEFVQMWVLPDDQGIRPGYEQLDVSAELDSGDWVPVASGRERAAIRINQRGATLWAARPGAGTSLTLPHGQAVHVYVARGSAELEAAGDLVAGDSARITGGGQQVRAQAPGTELLVWQMSA
jgi:redox-sensitive bicupin YhaK (pirin superfamily)